MCQCPFPIPKLFASLRLRPARVVRRRRQLMMNLQHRNHATACTNRDSASISLGLAASSEVVGRGGGGTLNHGSEFEERPQQQQQQQRTPRRPVVAHDRRFTCTDDSDARHARHEQTPRGRGGILRRDMRRIPTPLADRGHSRRRASGSRAAADRRHPSERFSRSNNALIF